MTGAANPSAADDLMKGAPPMDRLRGGLKLIAERNLFCNWRLETSGDSHDKPRKVPYVRGGLRLTGRFDAPELPSKLMTLEDAIADFHRRHYSGVGLVFFPGCGVIGVDFDHCLDANRELTLTLAQRKALALLKDAAYTERSQSDTGVHAIVLGDAQTVKANGELEVFGDKNFLALTGYGGKGVARQIDAGRIEKVIALVAEIKGKAVCDKEHKKRMGNGEGNSLSGGVEVLQLTPEEEGGEAFERVASALRFIDPDIDRDDWIKVIFAIRHGLGDQPVALELADSWSKGGLYAGK